MAQQKAHQTRAESGRRKPSLMARVATRKRAGLTPAMVAGGGLAVLVLLLIVRSGIGAF